MKSENMNLVELGEATELIQGILLPTGGEVANPGQPFTTPASSLEYLTDFDEE